MSRNRSAHKRYISSINSECAEQHSLHLRNHYKMGLCPSSKEPPSLAKLCLKVTSRTPCPCPMYVQTSNSQLPKEENRPLAQRVNVIVCEQTPLQDYITVVVVRAAISWLLREHHVYRHQALNIVECFERSEVKSSIYKLHCTCLLSPLWYAIHMCWCVWKSWWDSHGYVSVRRWYATLDNHRDAQGKW